MSLSEADMGVTQMALDSGANARFSGDEFLRVIFYMHPKLNRLKSDKEQRPIYEEVPYVSIMTPGNKDSIIQRPASAMDKKRFAEKFRAFEAQESQEAVEGTLLDEWAGVTRSQVNELKFFNIRTVEQLVGMSDANAQNIMGVQLLKQKAQKYLDDADAGAAAQQLADQQAINEQLAAKIAEMQAHMDAATKPKRKAKPKPLED